MRTLILFLCLVGSLPAQPGIVTSSYQDYTFAQHEAQVATLSGQGFRPVSLCVTGGWTNARYSAVWAQTSGPAWVTASAMTYAQYLTQRQTWTSQGFRPKLLSASSGAGGVIYAAVWVQDGATAIDWPRLVSFGSLQSVATSARNSGRIISQVARFSGYWACVEEPNADGAAWGVEDSVDATEYQADFLAHTEGGARPFAVGMGEGGDYVTVWRDDRIGEWAAIHDASKTVFANELLNQSSAGRFPLFIAVGGTSPAVRYTAVFGSRLTSLPRTLTRTGQYQASMVPFDTWLRQWMQSHGVRAASIAVTKDARLVYARGYTLAEAGYPRTEPTTLFRIGSISKPVTALLAHQLIETGTGGLTAETPAMGFLGIASYRPNYDRIRTWHLCEHVSGMPGEGNGDPDEWAAAQWLNSGNPFLPASESTMVGYTADMLPLSTLPGSAYRYSNIGSTLLGRMIVRASGLSYFNCLQNRLVGPLGITRFRRQSVRLAQHQPDEALYHLQELALMPTNYYTDRRLLTRQYARTYWDCAGGIVTSAVDLARITAAAFHLGPDSPIVSEATQATLLSQSTRSTWSGGTSQITRGSWYWARRGSVFTHDHNGSSEGFYAYALHRTDGVCVVICTNLDAYFYGDSINPLVDSITLWPTTDEFPAYGLPSFPRRPQLTSVVAGRGALENVSDGSFAFGGERIQRTTEVRFGNSVITAQNATGLNWQNGWFRIVDDATLEVHPPQGLPAGLYTVRAGNTTGLSQPMVVRIDRAANFRLGATSQVLNASSPLRVYATLGNLHAGSVVLLAWSRSDRPSPLPGIVNFDIGNSWSDLGLGPSSMFDAITGTASWNLPGIGIADPLYLQAAVLDPSAGLPLSVSNVEVVDRLF